LFDEISIRWTFLPFISIGADLAFGGNIGEPVPFSRGRSDALIGMGLKQEDEKPIFYAYGAMTAGLIFPLSKSDAAFRFYIFGDFLLHYGTMVFPGLFGDSLSPGFDVGLNFVFFEGALGMNLKYKGLWHKNNIYMDGFSVGFTATFHIDN